MQGVYRNLFLWFLLILLVIMVYQIFYVPESPREKWSYTEFVTAVERGEVGSVRISERRLEGLTTGEEPFELFIPEDPELLPLLRGNQVKIEVEPPEEPAWWQPVLVGWVPMLIIIFLWIMMIRQMQGGGGKAMSFGKARVRMLDENAPGVKFGDVAGVDEAKDELEEIVEFLRDPGRFSRFGGRIPKGVLLIGPPGTGKTMLARAVAGEAGVPFYTISGSDFVEMFVGVGASRVRDLFAQAKKSAPCIIFIDEIDAVGRHRGAGLGGGHDEREQTLNQLLVEMDGIEANEGVIILAATNRPDVLDPALLRPGRFDRRVVVPLPDWKGRHRILEVHAEKKNVPLAEDVDFEAIARSTPGLSGADLANLVNEAALIAARQQGIEQVSMEMFEQAKDKVLMGAERRSMVLTEEEKRVTAYHEAGHALVALQLPQADPVHKVTIIPRGMALGLTQQLPEREMHTYSRDYLEAVVRVLMGGRAAEALVFDSITTGAGNDIERATDIARRMVCEWGMSERIGPLRFGKGNEEVFLGRDLATTKDYSESTAVAIDEEVRRIVQDAYDASLEILREHRGVLDAISEALLERETIDRSDLELLVAGKPLPDVPEPAPAPAPAADPAAPEADTPVPEAQASDDDAPVADSDDGPRD